MNWPTLLRGVWNMRQARTREKWSNAPAGPHWVVRRHARSATCLSLTCVRGRPGSSRSPSSISTRFFMFSNPHEHSRPTWTRREFIRDAFCGFGGLALASLLYEEEARAAGTNPLAPKQPHFPAKAKSVIFLFMSGGPSHMEPFDPK